jgi:hypothetical protein
MEFTARRPAVTAPGKLLLFLLTLTGSSLFVMGQTSPQTTPQTSPRRLPESSSTALPTQSVNPGIRPNADETFELNIVERRYSQENFAASTAVGTSGERNLNLNIGVALSAGRIDLLLRNVHGTVRFRGSLDRILEIVGDSPGPAAASPSAPSP